MINGILLVQGIPFLLGEKMFPWKIIEQFLVLLDLNDIAIILDKEWVFFPPLLPDERPTGINNVLEVDQELLMFVIFSSLR